MTMRNGKEQFASSVFYKTFSFLFLRRKDSNKQAMQLESEWKSLRIVFISTLIIDVDF